MATRPIENKLCKWVYPPEKDDPEAMVWHFEPRLNESSLEESYDSQVQNKPKFDEWIVGMFIQFIKKVVIPKVSLSPIKEPTTMIVGYDEYTTPADILRIFKTVPENYGKYLRLAIQAEQPYLEKGILEKNSEFGRGSSTRPEGKSGASAKKKASA